MRLTNLDLVATLRELMLGVVVFRIKLRKRYEAARVCIWLKVSQTIFNMFTNASREQYGTLFHNFIYVNGGGTKNCREQEIDQKENFNKKQL